MSAPNIVPIKPKRGPPNTMTDPVTANFFPFVYILTLMTGAVFRSGSEVVIPAGSGTLLQDSIP